MDAKHILERVAVLKHEMEDLQVVNVGPDEPRLSKGVYEARLSRLEQIKMELAALLDQFKRTGTN
jgi:CMP-2-keto-3-deoxyoctulosonic acid synthetase